jgi:A/G-specific adenine glycosylase
MNSAEFQELVRQKGHELYRRMPWRDNTDPYFVLVSEMMLQQTQVDRVIPKFNQFIERFLTVQTLATASLAEVLTLWNGLGYNRRAKFLHDAAKKIVADNSGHIPMTFDELTHLPGVGPNTAGAILAYGYNIPTVFIETNIRTVYFYHFFDDSQAVNDTQLRTVVEETIDTNNPREFFWALMDYGASLKKQGVGNIKRSSHYKKQSALKGSLREVRGSIIRILTQGDRDELVLKEILQADERFEKALSGLIQDGLVVRTKAILHLTK